MRHRFHQVWQFLLYFDVAALVIRDGAPLIFALCGWHKVSLHWSLVKHPTASRKDHCNHHFAIFITCHRNNSGKWLYEVMPVQKIVWYHINFMLGHPPSCLSSWPALQQVDRPGWKKTTNPLHLQICGKMPPDVIIEKHKFFIGWWRPLQRVCVVYNSVKYSVVCSC